MPTDAASRPAPPLRAAANNSALAGPSLRLAPRRQISSRSQACTVSSSALYVAGMVSKRVEASVHFVSNKDTSQLFFC